MIKHLLCTFFVAFFALSSYGQSQQKSFLEAEDNWRKGDFISALNSFKSILSSANTSAYFEKIALITGELYKTKDLTSDGKNARFTPDGKFAIWERTVSGKDFSYYYELSTKLSGSLEGKALAILAGGNRIFLRTVPDDSLLAAIKKREEEPRPAPGAGGFAGRQLVSSGPLARLTALNTFLFSYNAKTKKEKQVLPKGWLMNEMVADPSGSQVIFTAIKPGSLFPSVFSLSGKDNKVSELITGKMFPLNLKVDPQGKSILFDYALRYPLADADLRPDISDGSAVYDLQTKTSAVIPGRFTAVDPTFSKFLYLSRKENQNQLSILCLNDLSKSEVVYSSEKLIADPVFSPDGGKITFSVKVLDDYEIFSTDLTTKKTTQVSAEIQHDRLPQFIGDSLILAAKGEPRHRRSYLYNIRTGTSQKLFHNNTVRTLVPEYDWEINPLGTSILVNAERDGNTISPERGIYLLDLSTKITKEELLARIDENLRAETELRQKGEESYSKIKTSVKAVTDQVSVHRIYDYENSLYHFGSKHITQPGNAKAIQYLSDMYKSFGYDPQIQWFMPSGRSQGAGRTANVYAVLKGTVNPEIVYVVSSHFDSVVAGPGADDDASGTAALLEAARVLADHPMPFTIIFASFTGEEAGLLGSKEFVRQAKENKMQIAGALNNDMVGWANDSRLDNTIRYSNPGIRDIQHAAAFLFSNLVTYDVVYYKSTDAQSYYDAYGDIVGGIGSYPVLGNPYYHQWNDFLETINHELVKEVSKTTVATLMLLASSPSRIKGLVAKKSTSGTTTISWQASPEKDVDHYIVLLEQAGGEKKQMEVKGTEIDLGKLAKGSKVQVKAVNGRDMKGWDWAVLTAE